MKEYKHIEWLEDYTEDQLQDIVIVKGIIEDLEHDRGLEVNSKYPMDEIIEGTTIAINFLLELHPSLIGDK
jgi:hypothetical protein